MRLNPALFALLALLSTLVGPPIAQGVTVYFEGAVISLSLQDPDLQADLASLGVVSGAPVHGEWTISEENPATATNFRLIVGALDGTDNPSIPNGRRKETA